MIIHKIPYEWVERLFGKFVADNFNTISLLLAVIGFILAVMLGRTIIFRMPHHRPPKKDFYANKLHRKREPKNEPEHEIYSETGWRFNTKSKKWEPPENLSEEANKKWKWDEEKRIWIDLEKEKRLERYRKFRESEGKGPTFEEWKKQRLAEKAQEEAKQNEDAAHSKTQTE